MLRLSSKPLQGRGLTELSSSPPVSQKKQQGPRTAAAHCGSYWEEWRALLPEPAQMRSIDAHLFKLLINVLCLSTCETLEVNQKWLMVLFAWDYRAQALLHMFKGIQ